MPASAALTIARELRLDSTELPAVLQELLDWAQANDLDLAGRQIASPSLEASYLGLTSRDRQPRSPSYA